jgi:catechol 2,3-dioxygenase-like lactoylglutathione lyase family enzyme
VPRAFIDHLDLVVSDLDRSLDFCRELLGRSAGRA